MVEEVSEAQRRDEARREHLGWLAEQRAEFEEHEARGGSAVTASLGSLSDADFAVGGVQLMDDDSVPVYRALAFDGPTQPAALEYEEEPIYRSIDLGQMAANDSVASPDVSAAATWAAAKRPPLLRRQNAFAFKGDDPTWLGLIGSDDQPSGR